MIQILKVGSAKTLREIQTAAHAAWTRLHRHYGLCARRSIRCIAVLSPTRTWRNSGYPIDSHGYAVKNSMRPAIDQLS